VALSLKSVQEGELLQGEEIKREFSPHPLSFFGLQSLWLFLAIWGIFLWWLVNSAYWSDFSFWLGKNVLVNLSISILWLMGIIIAGVIASVIMIRWRILFIYLSIFAVGVILSMWIGWVEEMGLFVPAYSIFISFIGFLAIEIYRRSHKYIITNLRIIFRGGILWKKERVLRYDKITDLGISRGILGRIFGFGDIIPITQSGFGLGNDGSFAAGGISFRASRKISLVGITGGKKEVQIPRARTYYELHGAYPYDKIRKLIETLVQESTVATYQKEQVELQKRMVDLLSKNEGSGGALSKTK